VLPQKVQLVHWEENFALGVQQPNSRASQVSLKVSLKEGDTIESVKLQWHVLESLLRVSRMLPIVVLFQNDGYK
jgi:hypothetical protein